MKLTHEEKQLKRKELRLKGLNYQQVEQELRRILSMEEETNVPEVESVVEATELASEESEATGSESVDTEPESVV